MNFPGWDTELFLALNQMGTEPFDAFWRTLSGTKVWIPLYLFIVFLMFWKLSRAQAVWGLFFLIINVFLTDKTSVYLFKEVFERLRPCHVDELIDQIRLVKGHCGGKYGFVSSHATNTFGLATFIFLLFRRKSALYGIVLFIWAAFVSYSRIYLGVHYPLDIIGGALLGGLCGWFSYFLLSQVRKRG
jgi:undecaprenyl-diphosphatase